MSHVIDTYATTHPPHLDLGGVSNEGPEIEKKKLNTEPLKRGQILKTSHSHSTFVTSEKRTNSEKRTTAQDIP